MSGLAQTPNNDWSEAGIRYLSTLYGETIESADEGDIIPPASNVSAVVELIKDLRLTPKPTIGITENGEIVLTWKNSGDTFKIVMNHLGKSIFWRNKNVVEKDAFFNCVAAVPAA